MAEIMYDFCANNENACWLMMNVMRRFSRCEVVWICEIWWVVWSWVSVTFKLSVPFNWFLNVSWSFVSKENFRNHFYKLTPNIRQINIKFFQSILFQAGPFWIGLYIASISMKDLFKIDLFFPYRSIVWQREKPKKRLSHFLIIQNFKVFQLSYENLSIWSMIEIL